MIELVRDVVVEMLHTREGTKVALHCLWHGSVKVSSESTPFHILEVASMHIRFEIQFNAH